MRIAYVTIHIEPRLIDGGVGSKIHSQVSIWKSMGHSVVLFSLTPEPISSLPDVEQFLFKPLTNIFLLKFLTRELARSAALGRLISQVRRYQPDVIYFRFGLFTFPLQKLFKIAPVVMEVNSNDQIEYRSRGPFFYWLNRITRNFMFSHSAGWIASSRELADLEANRLHRKPVCVVSNGIELAKYEPIPAPQNRLPEMASIVEKHHIGVVSSDQTLHSMAGVLNSLSVSQINEFKKKSLALAKLLNGNVEMAKLMDIYARVLSA